MEADLCTRLHTASELLGLLNQVKHENQNGEVLPAVPGRGHAGLCDLSRGDAQKTYTKVPPPIEPPTTPFGHTVAGSGIVEPNNEASTTSAIAVGSQI